MSISNPKTTAPTSIPDMNKVLTRVCFHSSSQVRLNYSIKSVINLILKEHICKTRGGGIHTSVAIVEWNCDVS